MKKTLHNITSDDDTLFRLIQKGDHTAFTHIYQKYAEKLYSLSFYYLKNKDTAENAVQHVFMQLWEFRMEIIVSISLKNYLYTMTKNFILNYMRDEARELANNYKLVSRQPQCEDSLIDDIEKQNIYDKLQLAIALLPKPKQQIVKMKREGYSNQEIADILHISINTVRAHYSQCVKILRAKLISVLFIALFIQ